MLQRIHDKVSGWFAGFLLVLLAVVFIFWGIDFGFSGLTYAAKVDGTKIGIEEVRNAYQNQLAQYQQIYRGELPPETRAEIQNNVLEAFVRNQVLIQRAVDRGYRVSDEQVMKSYESIEAFQIDGKYNSDVALRRLQAEGLSPAAFEEQQRRQLQVSQLQNAIGLSSFVTPAELKRVQALENEEREASWALVPMSAARSAGYTPDDTAIATYYEQHKAEFMTPETVSLKYVELKLADLEQQVQVTEEALRAHFDSVKDRYVQQERRRGRHILIQVPNDAADAASRKKAEDLLAKARAGADFSKLAKENSQDAGSAAQGGDFGSVERGFLVAPFDDAIFNMKVGEIRGPVRTQFGYHVILLDGIEAGHQKNFDEARREIEEEYRKQAAEKTFTDRQEELASRAFENPDGLDTVAQGLGLSVHSIPVFARGTGGGELGARPEILTAAFSENVLNGQNSEPVELEPGHIVVLHVADHREPAQRPLAEVRAAIVAQLTQQRAQDETRKLAEAIMAQLQDGKSWKEVLAPQKLALEGPKYVGRTDQTVPAELRRALFTAPKPAGKPHFQSVALGDGGFAVIGLSATRVAAVSETPEQQQTRVRQLTSRVGNSELAAYLAELRAEAKVDKNSKVFE